MSTAIRAAAVLMVLAAGAATFEAIRAYATLQEDVGLILALTAACLLAIAGLMLRAVGWVDVADIDAELARRFRQQARLAELAAESARREGRRSDVMVNNVQRSTWLAAAEHAEGARHAS